MHNLASENAAEDLAVKWDIAEIFRKYSESYRNSYPLLPSQLKVVNAITGCRTAALGGHLHVCDSCGYEHPVYNSCGNRHCPLCQNIAKAKWLKNRMDELLPVPYFHNVFTLPHILNPIARCNKKIIYDILFYSVSKTLLQFGLNPDKLGGKIGFISILHTWDQKLLEHIHLHCVIPAGAVSPDGNSWIYAKRSDFLFVTNQLSTVFRARFVEELKKAFNNGSLSFHGQAKQFESNDAFYSMINKLFKYDWVVYSKKPFAGPEQVLKYLSNYTHKIAISNYRIKKVENHTVTFTYRDRRDYNKIKELSLHVVQFMSRFLLHVLPDRYIRIRHFGFMAPRNRNKNIALAKKLLDCPNNPDIQPIPENTQAIMFQLTGKDISKCPKCKSGNLIITKTLPKSIPQVYSQFYPIPAIKDSS